MHIICPGIGLNDPRSYFLRRLKKPFKCISQHNLLKLTILLIAHTVIVVKNGCSDCIAHMHTHLLNLPTPTPLPTPPPSSHHTPSLLSPHPLPPLTTPPPSSHHTPPLLSPHPSPPLTTPPPSSHHTPPLLSPHPSLLSLHPLPPLTTPPPSSHHTPPLLSPHPLPPLTTPFPSSHQYFLHFLCQILIKFELWKIHETWTCSAQCIKICTETAVCLIICIL